MTARVLRIVAGVAILLGGAVHLERWLDSYRDLSIGPSFLANVVASVIVGTALFALTDRISVLAGLVLSIGSIVAIILSRTVGVLGFEESGYDRAAVEAIVFEVVAVVALLAVLAVSARGRSDRT